MKILATSFTLKNNSLDIYISGCNGNPKCRGCHNPESWNFELGEVYNENYFIKLKQKIKDFDIIIKNIMIFGGEPLDQNIDELLHFLIDIKSFNKNVWLFTRYDLDEIPMEVLRLCDFIKTGRYIPELKINSNIQYGINLATSNQKINKKGIDYI